MAPQAEEKKEEALYRADPLTFIFRELDLMRAEIREFKSDTKEEFANVNKRLDAFMLDVNKRFDVMNDSINKRFDRLYLIVILNLIGIVAFLIKGFFF
jgi:hypothetical protein